MPFSSGKSTKKSKMRSRRLVVRRASQGSRGNLRDVYRSVSVCVDDGDGRRVVQQECPDLLSVRSAECTQSQPGTNEHGLATALSMIVPPDEFYPCVRVPPGRISALPEKCPTGNRRRCPGEEKNARGSLQRPGNSRCSARGEFCTLRWP
jgi:hypothetical protein